MDIVYSAKFSREPSEIVSFGETGKLRSIVEPHIHYAFDTRFAEKSEELLGRLPGEAYGQNPHWSFWQVTSGFNRLYGRLARFETRSLPKYVHREI